MTFRTEKLEWLGYPMVKKFWRHVYSFWQNVRTWRTDRQTDTAWRHYRQRLCIASCGKNVSWPRLIWRTLYSAILYYFRVSWR